MALKTAFFTLIFFSAKSFAQTYTLNTGHQSISMEVKNMGYTADIFTSNEHVSDTYDVNYTVEFTLKCGDTKTYTKNTSVRAGKTDNCGGYTIAIPEVKGCERGISSARLTSFSAKPQQQEAAFTSTNSTSHSGNSASSTASNNSHPSANASVQELAEWQRRQYANTQPTSTSTSSSGTTATATNNANERQNRLNSIQQQGSAEWNVLQNRLAQDKVTAEDVSNAMSEIADGIRTISEINRKERESKARQAERAQLEREAVARRVNNRKMVIAEFPAKDIPLGSQEKAQSIYYFVYAYDNNTINNEYGSPFIHVSNVFEIGRYNDGTRVYTSAIKKEIEDLTPCDEILHGYYYTRQEAEEQRQTLISILKNNDAYIYEVEYKGRPVSKSVVSSTAKKENFWGETENTQNLAPAKVNTAKQSELPKETKKQEEKKKADFWD